MNQKTITNQCSISGYGIHTGKKVNLELYPAKEKTGIVFKRIDGIVWKASSSSKDFGSVDPF